MDTAANTGAGQPIAHASVDLDMRQWKDSQTYQAEVPLANDQAKHQSPSTMIRGNGCCLQEFPARIELHSLVSLRTCGHGLQQKYLNMPGHIRSWTLFVHERRRQNRRGLRGLPQTRINMSLIGIAGTGQGGRQAVVEVHLAAAVPPGPQFSAH